MSKHSKEEAELERIAKMAMPHTDRDKAKSKTRAKKKVTKAAGHKEARLTELCGFLFKLS